jgi:hypothetical protein
MQTHDSFQIDNTERADSMIPQQAERTEWLNLDSEEFSDEQIFGHLQSNPLGRLLRLIASLPEVRKDKVLRARREIRDNTQEIDSRLDLALDRVLEELIMEE